MNAVVEQTQLSAYERLPRRYRRFVDAYVPGLSAAEAVRRSGYNGLYPEIFGYRLLKKPEVAEAVEERTQHFIAEMGVRAERIIRETLAIATSDPRKLVDPETGKALPLHKLPADIAAAISAVDVEDISTDGETGTRYKYKLWDKNKAIEKLGQFRKLWDAKGPTVNVDARRVTNIVAAGPEALQGAVRLLEQARAIAVTATATVSDQNGSVLPAAVRDESTGRGTPVDAVADSGSPGAT